MKNLWTRLRYAVARRSYWEGIETGIGIGEYFERDRICQILRDQFVDLPAYTYAVSKPVELGEYLVSVILAEGKETK